MAQPKAVKIRVIFVASIVICINFFVKPALCDEILRGDILNSEIARTYRIKGYGAQKNGNISEALKYYQKALFINPAYVCIYNDLGVLYEMMGNFGAAQQAYSKVLIIDPGYAEVYSNLAQLAERQGDFIKAAKYWIKRINISKGDSGLWVKKAYHRLEELSIFVPEVKEMFLAIQAKQLNEEILCRQANTPEPNKDYPYQE